MSDAEWEAPRRWRARWPLAGLVLLAALGGWLVRTGSGSDLSVEHDTSRPTDSETPPDVPMWLSGGALEPGALVAGRWLVTTAAPLEGRAFASMTWTGQEALLWGGLADAPLNDGARYDPRNDTWAPLPKGPLRPRYAHAAVWTGDEMVIAGGSDMPGEPDQDTRLTLDDAAAFSPVTARWRLLPRLPFPTGAGRVFAAEGGLFAIAADRRRAWIAVLTPGAESWTPLDVPRPHIALGSQDGMLHSGLADGELVVWDRGGEGDGVAIDLVDPVRWRSIRRAPRPLGAFGDCCVLVASGAAITGVDVIGYDVDGGQWRPAGQSQPGQLVIGGDLIYMLRLHSTSGALHARSGTPLRLPPASLSPRFGTAAAWVGDRLLVWGGVGPEGEGYADGAVFRPLRGQ